MFTLAIVFAVGNNSHYLVFGGVLGLVAALAVAFAIYRLGKRINIGRFFALLGTILTVFAAGLLADAAENLQQLGWVNILTHQLWNTSGTLSEDSALGDVFHSLFGYADRPTVLQAVVYVGFLVAVLSGFRLMPGRQANRATAAPSPRAAAPR